MYTVNLPLTYGGIVSYYLKSSSSYSYSTCENREHPVNSQNKSVNSLFNWVPRYILFLAKFNGRERPFLEDPRRKATLWDYPQEHLFVTRDEKFSSFVKFEIIIPLLCCLLDPLTNKPCWPWSSMTNLWIDSTTYQK